MNKRMKLFWITEIVIILIVFMIVSNGTISSNQDSTDWPMYDHDPQHTGFSKSPAPDTDFLIWIFDTGQEIYSSPVVYKGNVYLIGDDKLYKIDAESGELVWVVDVRSKHSTPAIFEDQIFVTIANGIVSIDAENGSKMWEYYDEYLMKGISYPNYYFVSSPVVYEDKVFFGQGVYDIINIDPDPWERVEHFLVCLDRKTGKKLWHFNTKSNLLSSPTVHGENVYVISAIFYRINAKNGMKLLERAYEEHKFGSITWSSPIFVNGKILIKTQLDNFVLVDAYSGEVIWKFNTESIANSATPAYAYGKFYINSNDGFLYTLNEFSGEMEWKFNIGYKLKYGKENIKDWHLWSSLAVADDKVFMGSLDENFYVLDAESGDLIWKFKTDGKIFSSPAIADEKVFIASKDGKLYAFGIDPKTYLSKAEKYFKEKKYERAKDFYKRAMKYYEEIGDKENAKKARDKLEIAKQRVIENSERQEKLMKAEHLIYEAEKLISEEKFEQAIELLNETKEIYVEYDENEKLKLVKDRIEYAEKRIEEKLRKANNLLNEAEKLISEEEFIRAIGLLNEAKEIYVEYEQNEKVRLVEDRIKYAEKAFEEKMRKSNLFLFLIVIVMILIGFFVYKRRKRE